jgi:hypothetical protein
VALYNIFASKNYANKEEKTVEHKVRYELGIL